MADESQSDLFKEFEEFLTAKREAEAQNAKEEDHEIEVWTADGRGARARRSAFKPSILDELGLGSDPDPGGNEGDKGDKGGSGAGNDPKGNRQSKSSASNAGGTSSIARRYFTKQTPAK